MKARRFNVTLILALALASAVMTLCLVPLLMVSPIVPDTNAAQAGPTVAPTASPPAGCGGYLSYGDSRPDSITNPNSVSRVPILWVSG